MANTANYADAL